MSPRVGASVSVSAWNGPNRSCAKSSVVDVLLLVELKLVLVVWEVEVVTLVEVEPVRLVDWLVDCVTLVEVDCVSDVDCVILVLVLDVVDVLVVDVLVLLVLLLVEVAAQQHSVQPSAPS